jgi:diadenosine tetraphosphate (Ap4A) HIT family hydrolase
LRELIEAGYTPEVATGCFACDVNLGRIAAPGGTVYEDDLWIADHGVSLLVPGYLVLKPKRHVHELADLVPREAATLGTVLTTLHRAMREALAPERIYVCSFAETQHHLHFHMLPRYAYIPGLADALMSRLFAGEWRCSVAEAEETAELIRQALPS